MSEPMSLRGYAAHRREAGLPGHSHESVRRAIASGRLAASVTYLANGSPAIRDVAVADAEWSAATRPRADTPDVELDAPGAELETPVAEIPDYQVSRARREYALAQIAEVEARKMTGGEWIPKTDYQALEQAVGAYFRFCSRWLMQRVPGGIDRVFPTATRTDRIATGDLMRALLTELSEISPGQFLDPETTPVV